MKLSQRHKILLGITSAFIIINCLLLYFDNSGRILKTSHIKTWTETTTQDMQKSIHSDGVLDYADENNVYFAETLGEFDSFLVEEGQDIQKGEGLFTYKIDNFEETTAQLERDLNRIQEEIAAVEAAIGKMSEYPLDASPTEMPEVNDERDPNSTDDEDEVFADFLQAITDAQDTDQAELIQEQYVTEKEIELADKMAEQGSLEAQLAELMQTGDTVTVESPYAGFISQRSETLENPLLTIQSGDLVVKGEVDEREHMEIEPGQSVNMTMTENGQTLKGEVKEVSQFPKDLNLKGTSVYPFAVVFAESAENENDYSSEADESEESSLEDEKEPNRLPGYHTDLKIIIEKSPQTTVIRQNILDGDHVWKMDFTGKLAKVPVQTGIHSGQYVELIRGVDEGDFIAYDREEKLVPGSLFITSLKIIDLSWSHLKTGRWFQDFVTGILSR